MFQGDHVLLATCIFFLLSIVGAGSLKKFLDVLRHRALLVFGLAVTTTWASALSFVTGYSGEGIRTQYGWPHFFFTAWMSFDKQSTYQGVNPIYFILQVLFFGSVWLLIFVGWSRRRGKVLKIRFAGWKDPKVAAQFKKSFAHYEVEAAAGRAEPQFPRGIHALRIRDREVDGIGTAQGTRIDVEYDSKVIGVEEIKMYLENMPAKFLF